MVGDRDPDAARRINFAEEKTSRPLFYVCGPPKLKIADQFHTDIAKSNPKRGSLRDDRCSGQLPAGGLMLLNRQFTDTKYFSG